MRYQRRLHTIARQLGMLCPRHAEQRLRCPACDPLAPLPEPLDALLQAVFNSIMARVDDATLRMTCTRHLPPVYAPCGCGRPRQCGSCQERFTRAVLADLGLTDDEARMVDEAMALARAIDARAHGRP